MEPLDDYPLQTEEAAPPSAPQPPGARRIWMLVALIAVAAGALAYVLSRPDPGDTAQGAPSVDDSPAAAADTRAPLGSQPQSIELPPLAQTDPVVRRLLRSLSSRPELATWLATDNLLRGLAAAVDNVAAGRTPVRFFRPLAPTRPFSTTGRGEDDVVVVDVRSYARYDGLAAAVASLDAKGVASAYATLRPRLQEAYRELGYPEGNVDTTVERAIVHLLQTPAVAGNAPVRQAPVLYKYVDPRLEALSPAQKQLLRMGPANVRLVQQSLRELALALGIPERRLPAGSS